MTLVTTLTGKLDFLYTASVGGTVANYKPSMTFSDTLATGVALDTSDLLYVSAADALAGSATDNVDVAGSLSDAFGTTLTYVKIKMLYIKNNSTTAGNTITVGGHATAALLIFGTAAHTHTIGPNGFMLLWEPSLAGKAVTATTGDLLKILNDTANNVTYDIAIVGTSA